MDAHKILKRVHDAFKSVCTELAKLTGKTEETFRTHHREPKSQNALQSGNASPVTHYMPYVRLHEAAVPGAGRMLNRAVYEDLEMDFARKGLNTCTQQTLHTNVLTESYDVLKCLNEKPFSELSNSELDKVETEAAQMRDAASDVFWNVRAIKEMRKG